jgi:hypothetical protein
MATSEQDYSTTAEMLDQQEKLCSEQLKRGEREIVRLKRKRNRRIVQRSIALFCGVVIMLFGFIDIIVVKQLDANFNNILIFTLCELLSIPLLRYGLVLFRKLPTEQEITSAVEQLVEIQENLFHIRDEKLKLIRNPVKMVRPGLTLVQPPVETPDADLVTFDEPTKVCPECGEGIREGARICRTCGHLFI